MHQTALSTYVGQSLRGYGGGGESARTPIESPDSLRSIAYARIQDLISEGEIFGFANPDNPLSCMYLNETPIANADGSLNFKNVQVDSRVGTQTQDYMKGFDGVRNETAVGVELRYDTPWTRSFTNLNLSAINVRLSTPLFQKTDTSTGDITGTAAYYMIQLSIDGGPFNNIMVGGFVGKTTTKYERGHRIDLPPATSSWTIRVVRTTADSTSSAIVNAMYVEAFTEIVDVKLRLPMSAYVGTIVDAEQFSSIPQRAFHMKGRIIRVPSNYDPDTRTYTGVWDGTFQSRYSNNPAWVFYDMGLNERYGLGKLVPQQFMDKWMLYRIGQYCDQMVDDGYGGLEPRFTCNAYLQVQNDALQVMQDLATVFRGIMYAAGGAIVPVADMPEDAVYTYTNANVDDGEFTYSGSGKKVRYTVALVSWNDMTDFCRAKVEYVPDDAGIARYGVQETQVIAIGCTSRGQAHRLGRYILATNRLETDSIAFSVGLDGLRCAPGKIINVADRLRAGKRIGGRIVSSTADSVVLDSLPEIEIGDTLITHTPAGEAQSNVILNIVGATVTVSEPFGGIPVPQSVWAVEQVGDPIVKYRVLGVVEKDDNLGYSVHGIKHVSGKFAFADTGVMLDEQPLPPVPSSVVPSPINLEVTTRNVVEQNLVTKVATLSWDAVAVASAYNVQWRSNQGSWVDAGNNAATTREIYGIPAGPFEIQVVAIDSLGRRSLPTFGGPYDVTTPDVPPGVIDDVRGELDSEIQARIDADFDVAAAAAADATAKANAARDAAIAYADVIAAQLNDIIEADVWDNATNYVIGDIVQWAGKLYRAETDNIGQQPDTNPDDWLLMGNYTSLGEAVAAAVNLSTQNATDIEAVSTSLDAVVARMPAGTGELATQASVADEATARATADTALGSRVTVVEARMPAGSGQLATAAAVTTLEGRVTTAEDTITAQSSAITAIQSRLPAGTGQLATSAAVTALDARVTTAEGTITSLSTAITSVNATLGGIANDSFIVNGSFEYQGDWGASVNTIGTLPPACSYYGPTGNHVYHYTGTWSMWMTPHAANRALYNKARTPVVPGQVVKGSVRIRTVSGAQPDAGTTVRLGVRWTDKDGNLLGFSYGTYLTLDGSTPIYYPTNGYIQNNYTAVANAAFAQFLIYVDAFTTGGLMIDDVRAGIPSLEDEAQASAITALDVRVTDTEGDITALSTAVTQVQVSLAPSPNLVYNPRAANGSNGWAFIGTSGGQFAAVQEFFGKTGSIFRFGPYASGVAIDAGIVTPTATMIPLPSAGGRQFTVSADMFWHANAGASAPAIQIRWYNSSNVEIDTGNRPTVSATATNTWQRRSVTGTAPAGTAYAAVNYRHTSTTTAANAYTAVTNIKMESGNVATPFSDDATVNNTASVTQSLQAQVTTAQSGVTTMFARYTLALDVNGYVSGIRSENTGSTSSFDVLSDNFRILKPGGGARFEYSNGNGRVYDSGNVLRVRWGVWP